MLESISASYSEELIKSKKPVIVMFYAEYCPFCRSFAPIFESYSSDPNFIFSKADITDDDDPLWNKYNIKVVPTLVAFQEGREVARRDGVRGEGLREEDLLSLLQEVAMLWRG